MIKNNGNILLCCKYIAQTLTINNKTFRCLIFLVGVVSFYISNPSFVTKVNCKKWCLENDKSNLVDFQFMLVPGVSWQTSVTVCCVVPTPFSPWGRIDWKTMKPVVEILRKLANKFLSDINFVIF